MDKGFKWAIIILLALNTFFIGSIWCTIKCGSCVSSNKKAYCPISKIKGSSKICPLTGKTLSADEAAKGSVKSDM